MRPIVTASPAPVVRIGSSDTPTVSFVFVAYGTGPIIVDAIASLRATLADGDLSYEVIVVDNAHPTAPALTRRTLRLATAGVRMIEPGVNTGFGGGCELGAWHARGEVLAFVNPDLTFLAGWLEPLLAALDERDVSIAAPVLLEADGRIQEAGGSVTPQGWTLPDREPALTAPISPPIIDVEYASAACWLIKRDEHERIGGFDAAYHPAYFEDVDLALRARRLGGRCVVVPASTVVHHRGGSTPDAAIIDAQHAAFVARWPLVAWRAG